MSKSVEEVRRAAFEAWAPYRADLNKDGFYASSHTRAQWSAFNAALNLVCVELPDEKPMSHNHEREAARLAHNDAVEDCRAAIEQTGLGLRVK